MPPTPDMSPSPDISQDERSALPLEQAALLWCMRVWVVGMRHPIDAAGRIGTMADRLGAPGAGVEIEGFMSALAHGAARPIGVSCVCCPLVGADERALLDALALAQEARPFEALLMLRQMLTPEGARAALLHAEAIGAAFARAGRALLAPSSSVSHFAMAHHPATHGAMHGGATRPASATLH